MTPTTARFLVLAAACVAAGCQAAPPVVPAAVEPVPTAYHAPVGAAAAPTQGATIRLRAAIQAGGTRQLLAAVNELTKLDVTKLTLSIALKDTPAVSIASSDLLAADLDDELTFTNLKNATWYRVQATAYRGASPSFEKISLDDQSTYDFQVLQNDAVTIPVKIPVQLMPVTFSGTATSSGLTVSPGGYQYPGTETVGHKKPTI